MTAPKNADWVTGLRALADWLERNPDVDIDVAYGKVKPFRTRWGVTVQEARTFADRHGFTHGDEYPSEIDGVVRDVSFTRSFGPFTVEVWGEDPYEPTQATRKPTLGERIKAVFS